MTVAASRRHRLTRVVCTNLKVHIKVIHNVNCDILRSIDRRDVHLVTCSPNVLIYTSSFVAYRDEVVN